MRSTQFLSLLILSILAVLTTSTLARQAPTSYCKCICFTNSTIIPLNSPPPSSQTKSPELFLRSRAGDDNGNGNDNKDSKDGEENSDDGDADGRPSHRQLTCNDCNRAFCLDYDLPICKGAKEEDVFTSCFQRDSIKDEMVVFIFILLTASLLSWALLKPWVDRIRNADVVTNYVPVGSGRTMGAGVRRNVLPQTEYTDEGLGDEDGTGAGVPARGSNRHERSSGGQHSGLNS